MQLKIKASNMTLTPAIRSYFQEKMDMIEKYLGNIPVTHCDVEVDKCVGGQHKGDIFRAEVNLDVPHKLLRVERQAKDIYKAIDKVKNHLEIVIKKYKTKKVDKKKKIKEANNPKNKKVSV